MYQKSWLTFHDVSDTAPADDGQVLKWDGSDEHSARMMTSDNYLTKAWDTGDFVISEAATGVIVRY